MTQRNRRRHRRRDGARGKLLLVLAGALALIAVGAVVVASWVVSVASNAPPLSSCRPIDRGGNSVLFAGDGSRLGYIASDEAHTPVAAKRIPAVMKHATVSIEDERFFEHNGVDYEGGIRALIANLKAGKIVQGGSTITMQLMRNLCISNPKRDLERKIQEAQLAVEYEKRHSKQEILAAYLNVASYGTIDGTTAVGVQAAARIYFSRPVWKLTLEQAALLAGLPQAPSAYNPILNPRGARVRRNEVLSAMARLGYISHRRALKGERRGLELKLGTYFKHRQPYFFDYVENKLIERYGVNTVRRGGLRVYTTVDPKLQRVGLEAMHSTLPYSTDPASALVAIGPRTGAIKAMVSSSNYEKSKFNLAAQGHRQPGSTFKTFVLTTAIKQGIDPYTTYYTSKPLDLNLPRWGHWEVHTADLGYQGTINLQQATMVSDNTVFAQLDLDVGPKSIAATARSMGITTPLDGIPAEGIGGLRIGVSPLELADAYATLASGGIHRNPIAIRRVVFPGGRVDRPEHADPRRAVSRPVAYQVTRLLHDNITGGTGTAAYTGCPGQAGKTGTTDNYTDAWFAGYQPNLATAVWVGYPQSNEIAMTNVHGTIVFGGTFPATIWNSLYTNGEVPCEEFTRPATRISWAPFFGRFSKPGPNRRGSLSEKGGAARRKGEEATGGYNPDAYAPGVGQKPWPTPPPPRTPPPAHPSPEAPESETPPPEAPESSGEAGGGAGIGNGQATGGAGSGQ